MIQKTIVLTNPKGIHARPSAMILKTAENYQSEITLSKDGETANAADIMSILALGAMHGDTLVLTADGSDEGEALQHLIEVFERRFDDD